MKKKPLVSIIIPVYNGKNFLRQSIDSALSQTYNNIEIIIINDGSNDDGATRNIATKYSDKIRYFEKENGGVSSALNYGIKKMKGEFFSWLSHDDLYKPDKIRTQIKALEKSHHNNIIVMSRGELINEKGEVIGKSKSLRQKQYSANEMFHRLFKGFSLNGCSLLIPKRVFDEVGLFDEKLKYIQDWKMWVYITLYNYDFINIKKELVETRIHSQQQTVKIKDVQPTERLYFCLQLLNKLKINPQKNKDKIIRLLLFAKNVKSTILAEESRKALKKTEINLKDKIQIYSHYFIKYPQHRVLKFLKKYRQKWIRN